MVKEEILDTDFCDGTHIHGPNLQILINLDTFSIGLLHDVIHDHY